MKRRPATRRPRVRFSTHEKLHAALHPGFAQPLILTAQIPPQPAAKKQPNGLRAWFFARVRSLAGRYLKAGL